MVRRMLPISSITIDDAVMARCARDEATVKEYAEAYRKGLERLPPLDVFYDAETDTHWLADGCQRLGGLDIIGAEEAYCDVREGTKSDAAWFAASANLAHGLRMSPAQRRRSVQLLLAMPEFAETSDTAIAAQCGVSPPTVATMRRSMESGGQREPTETITVTDSHGTTRTRTRTSQGSGRPSRERQAVRQQKALKDGLGDPVPEWLRPVVEDTTELLRFQTAVSEVLKLAEKLPNLPSGAGNCIDVEYLVRQGNEMRRHIEAMKFFAVCPECRAAGKPRSSCRDGCNGHGWFTREEYDARHNK